MQYTLWGGLYQFPCYYFIMNLNSCVRYNRQIFFLMLLIFVGNAFCQTADELNKLRIAQALEQAGEYDKALDFYQQLYQLAPDNFIYFDGLRRTYMDLKEYRDAKTLVQERLTSEPLNVVLMCQLADVYYKEEQAETARPNVSSLDSAIIIWDKALALEPKNPNTYRAVASSMSDDRLFDKAVEVYREGEKELNSPTMFVNDVARLYFLSANYRESLHELLKMLNAPQEGQGQLTDIAVANIEGRLGVYSSSSEALAQFIDEMKKEVASQPGNLEFRKLLGFLFMETKDYPSAYVTYKWLDEHLGANGGQLLEFADRAYNDEAYGPAASAYKEISTSAKDNFIIARAIMGYANSMRSLGEKDFAEDDRPCTTQDTLRNLNASLAAYEDLISKFPNTQYLTGAVFNASEISMDYFHDFAGAEKLLDEHKIVFDIDHDMGIYILVRLYLLEGKFQNALDTALSAIRNLQSGVRPTVTGTTVLHDRIEYQVALALYYLGKYDSANYYLKEIISNPMSDAANDAIQLSNTIMNNRGNSEALKEFATASAMLTSNRIPEAVAELEEILKNFPHVSLADNARFDLATAYCKMGNAAEALKNYSALAADSVGIFADRAEFRICRIYDETLHEKDKAISEYENFLTRFPNSIYQDKVREILRNLLGENS